jgi:acyltransferase-like protein
MPNSSDAVNALGPFRNRFRQFGIQQASSGHVREKMTKISQAGRNPALDFTKGALVLIMVLYHWINYFYGPSDNRYLRFLTPSFIFITGFLISNIYFSKYGVSAPQLPKRLLQRGLKILAVFALLNVTRILLLQRGFTVAGLPAPWSNSNLIDAYLAGNGAGGGQTKTVAFFVLVPIAYLLMLSALLVVAARFYRYTFHVVCLFCLLGVFVLDFMGIYTYLDLLTIGLIGVLVGYSPMDRVNAFVRRPYLVAVAYFVYLLAITMWDVIYPLQIIGVFLSLAVIYLVGLRNGEPGKIRSCVILLGRYSLVGYIAQIAILQSLRSGLGHIGSHEVFLGLSFFLAFALTIASVEVLDRMRTQSTAVDRLYKAVFA